MSDTPTNASSPFLSGATRIQVALVLIALPLAHLLGAELMTLGGMAIGGGLGILNFLAMGWLGGRILRAEAHNRSLYAAIFLAKMTLLMGFIWFLLTVLPINILGFLIGISLFFPAVLLMLFWSMLSPAEPAPRREQVS